MKKQNALAFQLMLSFLLASINAMSNPAKSATTEEMSDKAFIQVDTSGIAWYNPRTEPFSLSGFEWMAQDGKYRRLPVRPDWEIPEAVDYLANYTAGGQVRFITDSKTVKIKVEYRIRTGKDYVPPSGKNGFDLYRKINGIPTFVKATSFSGDSANFSSELFVSNTGVEREFTLNFPLYNEVESLQIGLEAEAQVKAPALYTFPGKIVIYGTSITQGGSVSRPGMLYSNMLSRKLDARFVNLGFSGNGKGEPELAQLINQISGAGLIILDYEANASETISETLGSFIQIIRDQQADVPILLMSKIRFVREPEGSDGYKRLLANRDFQKKLIDERRAKGDQNIYFLDGSEVLGDDYHECSFDGVHPTDLGAYRIYAAMHDAILDIFPERKTGNKFIADHTVARENVLRSIPQEYIDMARTKLHVAYQHTSHGTHVSRGMFGLQDYKPGDENLFAVTNRQPESGKLDFWDNPIVKYAPEGMDASDLSHNENAFIQATRNFLDDPANKAINVLMWSWCNIGGHKAAENYLPGMDSLIAEYGAGGKKIGQGEGERENPVTFIFMTGHSNEDENLGEMNPKAQAELIIDNCRKKNQFCLDYYSIDTHDMKGRYWEDAGDDGNSKRYGGNFYADWQSQYQPGEGWFENRQAPGGKVVFGAHNTQHITANRKAYAMWWILARIAGWDGN